MISNTDLHQRTLVCGSSWRKDEVVTYLQVREHAQQAPQQTAVYRLSVSLPLDEQQDPVDGFTLDLQITDDVEPEQLQTHVPADQSSLFNAHF